MKILWSALLHRATIIKWVESGEGAQQKKFFKTNKWNTKNYFLAALTIKNTQSSVDVIWHFHVSPWEVMGKLQGKSAEGNQSANYIIVDTEPFCSRANLLPGGNRQIGPWPICCLPHLLPGSFAPWNFRSMSLSLPKVKITKKTDFYISFDRRHIVHFIYCEYWTHL